MEMGGKSRQPDNGTEDDNLKKTRTRDEVDDDEVEEFFTILRRMKAAARLLSQQKKMINERCESDVMKKIWIPAFELVDFKYSHGNDNLVTSTTREGENGEKRASPRLLLDLNADP